MPSVLAITHLGKTTRVELADGQVATLGRSADCEIVVDDRQVSRRHATFRATPAGLEVEDLGSHNGTAILRHAHAGHGETISLVAHERLVPGAAVLVDATATVQIGPALVTLEGPPRAAVPAGTVVVDPQMARLYDLAERVAVSDLAVLVHGESGVGKELVAQFVHQRSRRAGGPLVSVNCGAIAESLVEAELFGYEKGAFTGAARSAPGLLETAHRGTVFLDEIGELPASAQVKLLRVLEVGEVLRVGGRAPIALDVRYVAATNRDLAAEVAAGRFREDLYYRLNGITLAIPPLRERRGEIVPLAEAFARRERGGGAAPAFTAAAIARLTEHDWPGNVRQLRNAVRRAAVLSGAGPIGVDHLQLDAPGPGERTAARPAPPPAAAESPVIASDATPAELRRRAAELERQRVIEALAASAGNQTRAARMLGMTRRALVARLGKYGLPRPRKGR